MWDEPEFTEEELAVEERLMEAEAAAGAMQSYLAWAKAGGASWAPPPDDWAEPPGEWLADAMDVPAAVDALMRDALHALGRMRGRVLDWGTYDDGVAGHLAVLFVLPGGGAAYAYDGPAADIRFAGNRASVFANWDRWLALPEFQLGKVG